ncbi:MAG: hypothetical protein LBE92_19880 [Chryseobacterium sp.]|jgi:tetratricopeptide (TPR) repeat protein|uniref:hypothetical protein n=1 Tax=Chryseobacterium sp. TaxID=1871047 RepID=UPI002819193D|nr:hypothetical protein [Chryseobacterium sp.]MDR2238392.1 hypothetical protein [Chryseobacterium sp.]
MAKKFSFLLLVIFTISCSDPTEKQKIAEENFQKKEIAMLDKLEFSGSPQLIIKTAEEAKRTAQKINYNYGIFKSNMSLIFAYNASDKYKEAVLIGRENDELVNKIKADYIVCLNYTNVASAYLYLGLFDEAKNYLNKALAYNQKLKNNNNKFYSLSLIYGGFAYLEGEKGDSASETMMMLEYGLKQLEALQEIDESNEKMAQKKNSQLTILYVNLGVLNQSLKNTKQARVYFYKALDLCNKYKFSNAMLLHVHLAISRFFLDEKEYDQCIIYAEKGIVLEKESNSPDFRADLYKILYKANLMQGNREKSEMYTSLYMKLNDSLITAENRAINTPVKLIVEKKEKEKNNTIKNVIIISAVISFLLLLCGWLFWRRKNKKLQKDFKKLIEKSKSDHQNTAISLGHVSTDDKIYHVVRLLYFDPESRVYKADDLAKNYGFNSKSEFTKAFKTTTGIHFSYFIKKLEKESK